MLRTHRYKAGSQLGLAPVSLETNPAPTPEFTPLRFDILPFLPGQTLAAFMALAHSKRFANGQLIYQQGDFARTMFRVVSGQVRLSLLRRDGRELVFVDFQPGDCFGVSSLIDGRPLPHTATAVGEVEVQIIDASGFALLRLEHPGFDAELLRLVCLQMRRLSDVLADAALEGISQQLARRLLDLARNDGDGRLVVQTSQAELARMFGAARQTINRLLGGFEADNLIRRGYGAVVIEDAIGLRARAGEAGVF